MLKTFYNKSLQRFRYGLLYVYVLSQKGLNQFQQNILIEFSKVTREKFLLELKDSLG